MEKIEIFSVNEDFNKFSNSILNTAQKALEVLNPGEVSLDIFLVSNKEVATNVLAFPSQKDFPRPDKPGEFIGEIYLNPDYIKSKKENLNLMVVHGILHLLGFKHDKKNERLKMEHQEKVILSTIN